MLFYCSLVATIFGHNLKSSVGSPLSSSSFQRETLLGKDMENRDGVAWTVFETIWIQTFVQCLTVPRLIRLRDAQYPIGMFSTPTNIKRYLASLALSAV